VGGFMTRPFWNYFWTAQLIAGLAMAWRIAAEGGALWAIPGFLSVAPLSALLAKLKVAHDRRHGEQGAQRLYWWEAAILLTVLLALPIGLVALAKYL
jgi:hypothetical protein